MSNGEKFKIIMVNSFKGGTGKTTVALSHCIHEWIRGQKQRSQDELYYDNIYFMDIDRLGTSMSYYLFPDKDNQPVYFDEYPEKKAECVCNQVPLPYVNDEGSRLYAVLLNPVANRRQNYSVRGRMWQHEWNHNGIFQEKLFGFMKECMAFGKNSLFVVDCSPGLSEMEYDLLNEFYTWKNTYSLSVEELYVTTFENGQIRKTIECLNDNRDLMYRSDREASIVLNDLQNCIGITRDDDQMSAVDWEVVGKEILEKLKDREHMKIRYKDYKDDQIKAGIWGKVRNLDNITDIYVLPLEYQEGFISGDWMV